MNATWAERYVERFGFALTPLRGKAAYRAAWNTDAQLIRSAEEAHQHWWANPTDGLGVCLEPSGLVSLDADDLEGARQVLAAEGIELEQLIATTPTIIGRAPRLEFQAPALPLERRAITWPSRDEPWKKITVLELRAGRIQDVLPPSIHPETHQAYRWATPPRNGFPPLPSALLRLWQDFDAFTHRARNLCPWAEPEPEPAPRQAPRPRPPGSVSVIAAFNAAHDPTSILKAHGYVRVGKRWRSPHAKPSSAPGVVLLKDGRVFQHDSDDPLADGRPHDAFDLFTLFDHRGDVRAATRAAAEALGMRQSHG